MSENLSVPQPFSKADPSVIEALFERYPNQIVEAIQFPGFFDKVPRENEEILSILGEFKDDVVDYAQDTYRRKVKRVDYVADMRDARPGEQQRKTMWHTEQVPNGISILVASELPTLFITKSSEDVDVEPYLRKTPIAYIGSYVYSAASIADGKEAGALLEVTPSPYDMVELDGRIHCGPVNLTGEIVKRAFIGCEVVFKKESRKSKKIYS